MKPRIPWGLLLGAVYVLIAFIGGTFMPTFTAGFFTGIVYTIAVIGMWRLLKDRDEERRLDRVFKEVDDDGTSDY